MTYPTIIAYSGLPGAGKTEAARIGHDLLGGTLVSMGDTLRMLYEAEHGPVTESHALGVFATDFRKRFGPGGLARRMVDRWPDEIAGPIHVDGVRCVREIEILAADTERLEVLFIEAADVLRHRRLTQRQRDGEESFTLDDLWVRDAREYGWGVADVKTHPASIVLRNDGSLYTLRNRLASNLQTVLGFSLA